MLSKDAIETLKLTFNPFDTSWCERTNSYMCLPYAILSYYYCLEMVLIWGKKVEGRAPPALYGATELLCQKKSLFLLLKTHTKKALALVKADKRLKKLLGRN